jgi:hypothetical protein
MVSSRTVAPIPVTEGKKHKCHDIWQEKPKVLGEKRSQYHHVHHRTHMYYPGNEPGHLP